MPLIEDDETTQPEENEVLKEALALHRAGWWVVPQLGKRALALGWDKHRLSEDDLREYLSAPNRNIAIALNQSEVVDVECDSEESEVLIQKLCTPGQLITPTWRSRRGLHRFFKRPSGLPDNAKVMAEGIEFRLGNKGALTTVPPSVHEKGNLYEWLEDLSVWDIAPSPLPDSLVDLINSPKAKARSNGGGGGVGTIAEGSRNEELFRYGCRLLRENHKAKDILNALVGCNKACCRPPLGDGEVAEIARSVEQYRAKQGVLKSKDIDPVDCEEWGEVLEYWKVAHKWRQNSDDVLSCMLAVAASTSQVGDQLFLQVIGEPGTGKTKFCEAMLVSKTCHMLDHLTGFHSGVKDGSGKEYSLLDRINHKTVITPEADTLMSSPRAIELLGQQRRIFDGTSGATYKNTDEDKVWTGLRTPWIQAGTKTLLDGNQARLGDRFLKVMMDTPPTEDRVHILRRVAWTAAEAVRLSSNCDAASTLTPKMRDAYQHTGGYVNWLRANVEELISKVEMTETIAEECSLLAEFTGEMRAHPHSVRAGEESNDVKELPTRLTHQFVRLALCLAVVLNKSVVDDEVMYRVRKVAIDTGYGPTQRLVRVLLDNNRDGVNPDTLAAESGQGAWRIREHLRFLSRIGTVDYYRPTKGAVTMKPRWRLSDRMRDLCEPILENHR